MRHTFLLTAACLLLSGSSLVAQAVFVDRQADSPAVKALARPVSVDFQNTVLRDVVDFVKDYAGVNVILDANGLDIAGVQSDEPITLSADNVPLSRALRLILDPLEMEAIVKENVIFITDREETAAEPVTRVYPVLDIVAVTTKDGQKLFAAEEMIETLMSAVSPDEWDENGGNSDIAWEPANVSLVIRCPRRTHEEIVEFIEDLRASRGISDQLAPNAGIDDVYELAAEAVKDAIARRENKKLLDLALRKAKAEAEEAEERAKLARIEREKAELELAKLREKPAQP